MVFDAKAAFKRWYEDNKEHNVTRVREWRKRTQVNHKSDNLRKHGLSIDQYHAMFERQGEKCAICKNVMAPTGRTGAHVDHDHATGAVRGLLCCGCNTGIGKLRDDPELLRRAATYLEVGK